MERIAFQAKARTVDHLGREQIADCPTAVSELWKNSYDAYARNVELNLFQRPDEKSVAALLDDGHGMNREEFITKWLVVGTESKATDENIAAGDRNGLSPRPKLGQKGIGRLSSANLGPLCFIVTKRRKSNFVVSLIDWRLFENPFLNLADIFIPVDEVNEASEVFEVLDKLRLELLTNLPTSDRQNSQKPNSEDQARTKRVIDAWNKYDAQLKSEQTEPLSGAIARSLSSLPFTSRHIEEWPVWKNLAQCGTAMLVSELNFDLEALVDESLVDTSAVASRRRFIETLSSFVDPYAKSGRSSAISADPEFSYAVNVWNAGSLIPRLVVGSNAEISIQQLSNIEHIIDGVIDEEGVFRGSIRAFGQDLENDCVIQPPSNLKLPRRNDGKVGPVGLFIAAMEFSAKNTSLPPAEYEYFKGMADRFSGFLVFRDGLRVLPYGRTDNDFFEIESRRSLNAGREFWNHRQMFGRVALSRARNPNLKDKAGREGFLDNRAAKVLKELVMHTLMTAARRYFGSASEIRKSALPVNQAAHAARKAKEDHEKLRKANAKKFRRLFKEKAPELPLFHNEVESFSDTMAIDSERDIEAARVQLEDFREKLKAFSLPTAPKLLGSIAAEYDDYRSNLRLTKELVESVEISVADKIEQLELESPDDVLSSDIERLNRAYTSKIQQLKKTARSLLQSQYAFLDELEHAHSDNFIDDAHAIAQRVKTKKLTYFEASSSIGSAKIAFDQDVEEAFSPYIAALEILQENVDLANLATYREEENSDLRAEVDRLNSLAQLGVAVEITGHELQNYANLISASLSKVDEKTRRSKPIQDLELGLEGLLDQLRFLSPMGLSGDRVRENITGQNIFEYVREFFALELSRHGIEFSASDAFRSSSITEFKSRIYPVFINLVNNSVYWVANSAQPREVLLDVVGSEVVVSDTGPGVLEEDINGLFTLFFTKKTHGGRGVGLYLCRSNLAAGGHKIRYVSEAESMPLSGANFAIKFSGISFDKAN